MMHNSEIYFEFFFFKVEGGGGHICFLFFCTCWPNDQRQGNRKSKPNERRELGGAPSAKRGRQATVRKDTKKMCKC